MQIHVHKITDDFGYFSLPSNPNVCKSLVSEQNILLLDTSGSMSEFLPTIIDHWNNTFLKSLNNSKVIMFDTRAYILETGEITEIDHREKSGGRTNIINGLNKLFEIIEPNTNLVQKYNILFITDGHDNCNKDFDNIFKQIMGAYKPSNSIINFYVLGIGIDFPIIISNIIRDVIHNGKTSITPLYCAFDTEQIIEQMNKILLSISMLDEVEITSNVILYKNYFDVLKPNFLCVYDLVVIKELKLLNTICLNGVVCDFVIDELYLCDQTLEIQRLVNMMALNIVFKSLSTDVSDKALELENFIKCTMSNLVPTTHIKIVCDELNSVVSKSNNGNEMKFLETLDKLDIVYGSNEKSSDVKYCTEENLQLVVFTELIKNIRSTTHIHKIMGFEKIILEQDYRSIFGIGINTPDVIMGNIWDNLEKINVRGIDIPIVLNAQIKPIVKSELFQMSCEKKLGKSHQDVLIETIYDLVKNYSVSRTGPGSEHEQIFKLTHSLMLYAKLRDNRLLWWNPKTFVRKYNLPTLCVSILGWFCDKTNNELNNVFGLMKVHYAQEHQVINNLMIIIGNYKKMYFD